MKNLDKLKELFESLLVGQEIEKADGSTLTLKNGTTLRIIEDFDCCCSADGGFKVTSEDFQAAITSVEVTGSHNDFDDTSELKVTILHNGEGIVDMQGSAEGYIYYFTALSMNVVDVNGEDIGSYYLIDSEGRVLEGS